MKKSFRPEFLNRVDDIIVFAHLQKEEVRQIADIMLKDLFKRLEEQQIDIQVSDDVKEYLAKGGYSENYGARPLRRLIQKKIEDPIAEEILSGEYKPGDVLQLNMEDDKITFKRQEKQEQLS